MHATYLLGITLEGLLSTLLKQTYKQEKFKGQCDTLTSENEQLLRSIENMSELSEQLMNANKTVKDLEQQLEISHIQVHKQMTCNGYYGNVFPTCR